jgi:acetylornithine deacetylase/succinyl-diaminopimelate desuccinylase-like protein
MKIDWDEVEEEAIRYLSDYVRINTINPPGNETPAALFLQGILEAEGLKVETYGAKPERLNLLCRLKGNGAEKPLILLHHMDVVAAERETWSVDPFGGDVRDGYIWGRGTVDMKGFGIVELLAFLLIRRLSIPLTRDLIYLATADEETGSMDGAEWMVRHHYEKIDGEYLLNEGGFGLKSDSLSVFNCCIGEKGPVWIRLSTEGTAGHGSMPHNDNACVHLVKAIDRIADYKTPFRIIPQMRRFLDMVGIGADVGPEELVGHPLMADPAVWAMFRDTISITGLRAGQKENVIPSRAEATLDCRLLPGTDRSAFIEELKGVIDDKRVKVDVIMEQEASYSPGDTAMYKALEEVLAKNYPGVPMVPMISPGFTDSRCFRKKGVYCYGLLPFVFDRKELSSVHGKDERLSIENLGKGIKTIFELIKGLCCR